MTSTSSNNNNNEPIQITQGEKLRDFYGAETATMYAGMMEDEMVKYTEDFHLIFQTLGEAFPSSTTKQQPTRVLDTCCGSGHMLKHIGEYYDKAEDGSGGCAELTGLDLSPDMVNIAKPLVPQASFKIGNMLDMSQEPDSHYHLVLNNFAMHHATAEQAQAALKEYARILAPKGCLFFSAWEGNGKIDYGDMEMDAKFHSEAAIKGWIEEAAGLNVLKCRSFVEKEMGDMNSIYVVAQKSR